MKLKHMSTDNFNKTCKNKRAVFTYSFNFTSPLLPVLPSLLAALESLENIELISLFLMLRNTSGLDRSRMANLFRFMQVSI